MRGQAPCELTTLHEQLRERERAELSKQRLAAARTALDVDFTISEALLAGDYDRRLTREIRSYRLRRTLGWIGGNALAERDMLGLRSASFSAWKDELTPSNLGLSLPSRILRGYRSDGQGVRDAAMQYLEIRPDDSGAETAREWLDHVGWPSVDINRFENVFELSVSPDSVYAGPILRKARCTGARDAEDTSARLKLPFGLGSRCVLRAE